LRVIKYRMFAKSYGLETRAKGNWKRTGHTLNNGADPSVPETPRGRARRELT